MADVLYNYVISTDTLNGAADAYAVHQQIKDSDITVAFRSVVIDGDNLNLWFKASLYAIDVSALNALVAAHDGVSIAPPEPPVHSDGAPIVVLEPFAAPCSVQFNGQGARKTIPNGTTDTLDYQLAQMNKFDGIQIILKDHHEDDCFKLKLIDVENLLGYGANYVLYTFINNWNVASDKQDQGAFRLSYSAEIPTGLYLRCEYTSFGTTDVKLKINHSLHKEIGT